MPQLFQLSVGVGAGASVGVDVVTAFAAATCAVVVIICFSNFCDFSYSALCHTTPLRSTYGVARTFVCSEPLCAHEQFKLITHQAITSNITYIHKYIYIQRSRYIYMYVCVRVYAFASLTFLLVRV